jgi:hypothetical protein
MAEAAVVHASKSAVAVSTAVKPATKSAVAEPTAVKPTTKSPMSSAAVKASWRMRQRQPAGNHEQSGRRPGLPDDVKRCFVHMVLPCSEWDSL